MKAEELPLDEAKNRENMFKYSARVIDDEKAMEKIYTRIVQDIPPAVAGNVMVELAVAFERLHECAKSGRKVDLDNPLFKTSVKAAQDIAESFRHRLLRKAAELFAADLAKGRLSKGSSNTETTEKTSDVEAIG